MKKSSKTLSAYNRGCARKSAINHFQCCIYLGRRREAHILNYMYKDKEKEELLDTKDMNTRSRAAPLFKTVRPSCENTKTVLYSMVLFYGICYLLTLLCMCMCTTESVVYFPQLGVLYVICSVSYILYQN